MRKRHPSFRNENVIIGCVCSSFLFFSSSSLSLSLYLPKYKSISFTSFSICSTSVKQKPMCVIGGKETPAGGGDRDLLLTLWRHQKVTDMKSIHPDSFISFFETRVYIGNHQQQHKFRIVSFFCRPVASLPTKNTISGWSPDRERNKKKCGRQEPGTLTRVRNKKREKSRAAFTMYDTDKTK